MKRQLLKTTFLIFLVVVLSGFFGDWNKVDAWVYSLKITSPTKIGFASPETVTPVTFTAETSDPQGFYWSAPVGTLSTTTADTTIYTPPSENGEYLVTAISNSNSQITDEATVTVGGPVTYSVNINPGSTMFSPGATYTFSATTTDPSGISWWVDPEAGTIDENTGFFTASSNLGTYELDASPASDPDGEIYDTINITISDSITPTYSVMVNPDNIKLLGFGSTTTFFATTDDPSGLWWEVRGGGTIDPTTGVFTASSTPGTYEVDVFPKSNKDNFPPGQYFMITVGPILVSINPGTTTFSPGATYTFSATTSDPTGVFWQLGSIYSGPIDENTGFFTASSNSGTYELRAYPNGARNGQVYDAESITISSYSGPSYATYVVPGIYNVFAGNTVEYVAGTMDPKGVTWSVVESSGGTIAAVPAASGGLVAVYTAPSTAGTYHIRATNNSNNLSYYTATVNVISSSSNVVSVSISPVFVNTNTGQTVQFAASVGGGNNRGVVWSVSSGTVCAFSCPPSYGSIDQNGLYTASAYKGNYSVGATSVEDPTKGASATVVVQNGGTYLIPEIYRGGGGGTPPTPAISISPDSTQVQVGGTLQFQALLNSLDTTVSWSVEEGRQGGSITPFGEYTAPLVPGTYHLIATSTYGTAQATVNVVQGDLPVVSITIQPSSVKLLSGTTQQFTAQLYGATSSTGVTWGILEGSNGGAINSSGLYVAPDVIATSTYHVLVTSIADPSKVATSTVYVIPVTKQTQVPLPVVTSPVIGVGAGATLNSDLKKTSVSATSSTTTVTSTPLTIVAPVNPTPSIISQVTNGASVAAKQVAKAAGTTVSAIQSPVGSTVVNTVSTAGAVAGASAWTFTSLLASPIFASPIATSEILFVPLRLWGLVLSALGLKRRNRPWGTVYDSVTKMPVDPAIVTLRDEEGHKIATSITDVDGRFGFMVPKGKYRLNVQKTNYSFPSKKLSAKVSDELYSNLYFGEPIEVAEDGLVIYKNIPMDPKHFDWNEFTKNKMGVMQFNSPSDKFNIKVTNAIFWFGFAVALISVFIIPHVYSITILSLYVILIALRYAGTSRKPFGIITDKENHPLSFAAVSIYSKDLHRELFKKVADQFGHYYALVPKGDYEIRVSRKNLDESYTEVYEEDVNAKEGVINESIKV